MPSATRARACWHVLLVLVLSVCEHSLPCADMALQSQLSSVHACCSLCPLLPVCCHWLHPPLQGFWRQSKELLVITQRHGWSRWFQCCTWITWGGSRPVAPSSRSLHQPSEAVVIPLAWPLRIFKTSNITKRRLPERHQSFYFAFPRHTSLARHVWSLKNGIQDEGTTKTVISGVIPYPWLTRPSAALDQTL